MRILLANGFIIESGWVDEDDPGLLPTGDYLSVENKEGRQIFYEETADLISSYPTAVKRLHEFLQACQGLHNDFPEP